jgi:flagellar basal body P-ring protein FlgI
MKKRTGEKPLTSGNIERYLKILVQIEIQKMFSKENGGLKIAEASRFLNSLGCTPTEIAAILGKETPQQISPYLYGQKPRKRVRGSA